MHHLGVSNCLGCPYKPFTIMVVNISVAVRDVSV